MWLDIESGAKCYMVSAKALHIVWGDTPQYWRWIPLTDSRFSEGAELLSVCWLEINGKIQSNMLSANSAYAAYFVFKLADSFHGLEFPAQETSVSLGGGTSNRRVILQGPDDEDEDEDNSDDEAPHRFFPFMYHRGIIRSHHPRAAQDSALTPQERGDGWMEVEMGEFYSGGGDDGEVCFSLRETKGGNWKRGLIVQGVEIRPKE